MLKLSWTRFGHFFQMRESEVEMRCSEKVVLLSLLVFSANLSAVQLNDQVTATTSVNARMVASGTAAVLLTVPAGSVGSVIEGPTTAGGSVWWLVRWNSPNVAGWSIQDYLATISAAPPNGSGSNDPGIPAFLQFPLGVATGKTLYDAPISAVLDHSVEPLQGGQGYYHRNGIIKAYNGETVTIAHCRYSDGSSLSVACDGNNHSLVGYLKSADGNNPMRMPLLGGYQDEDSFTPGNLGILWYDGHSGYDYPAARGTHITAATSGVLCVASARTAPDQNNNLWRASSVCPYASDVINGPVNGDSWDGWHVFYIVYPTQYGGNTYSTFYLHADRLADNINSLILQNGYANVTAGDFVALVGHTSPPTHTLGNHLHFEVRQNGTTTIDPYGDGSPGNPYLLWLTLPAGEPKPPTAVTVTAK
jgi:hypothetical protein